MRHSLKCNLSALVAGGRYLGLSRLSAWKSNVSMIDQTWSTLSRMDLIEDKAYLQHC